jgi:hypothetical protein
MDKEMMRALEADGEKLRQITGKDHGPLEFRFIPCEEHDLYETGDPDAPDVVKDRNGKVVLGLCRRCGRAEIELSEPCEPKTET